MRPTAGSAAAISPAITAASAPTHPSASGSAAISWSAAPRNSYALQPISVQGQTGLNVAAGIADIQLEPVRSGCGGPPPASIPAIAVTAERSSR